MKRVSVLVSVVIMFAILGCSKDSHKVVVAPSSVATAGASPVAKMAAALPVPSIEHANDPAWGSEDVIDPLGNAVALKATSRDGKFDLVILQRGPHSFLSLVRHAHWESVRNRPAKGRLIYLRVKFEDGVEKRIEWDELGFATENLYGVLWSYPAKPDAPIGPATDGSTGNSVGGDQLLVQDMLRHKTMLLEVEPAVTTQFDMTGLAYEIGRVRTPQTQPIGVITATTQNCPVCRTATAKPERYCNSLSHFRLASRKLLTDQKRNES